MAWSILAAAMRSSMHFDATTGKEKWKFDNALSWVITSPAVVDRKVYFATSDSSLYHVMDAATGKPILKQEDKAYMFSSPAVTNDVVFIGVLNGTLEARDRNSGKLLWEFQTETSKQNANWVLTADRRFNLPLLFFDGWREGPLVSADRQFAIGAIFSSPLVANGVVYFGSTDGFLYALEWGGPSRAGIVRHRCTDNLTSISKAKFARIRERSDSNCRLASGWLLRGVFVFGRILGAATATANFFFFAGFKVADEHVELDNALLFRIFVGFRLFCHNCASCESDDDDRILVCRAKTALARVDCGDGRLGSRGQRDVARQPLRRERRRIVQVPLHHFSRGAQVQGRQGESSTGLISLNRPKRAKQKSSFRRD